ncbi:MAG: UDP-glucose--hexose-1-phosphate uridylyltransferase [Clostridiales bacterium]|nr:UDP-glucose--hexose-1-phosphate uridylyltransferase [Clostridiales bacterium]
MINHYISDLVEYGLETGLITKHDRVYTINSLLEFFQLEQYDEAICAEQDSSKENKKSLEEILAGMLDYAYEHGILKENSVVYRDLFDTKIMGTLVPRPSVVINKFQSLYSKDPKEATEFYYKFSQDTDYIRRYRIKKDMKWVIDTEYGSLDITINLSKPEKDPKAIAAAKTMKQSSYPKCQLCRENEGYAGRVNHPARQNHRIIPVELADQQWGFQYSPYVYYNEHCIVFNYDHIPMKIDKDAFRKLFDFVKLFPHYFVGSNADLPIVGGSILTHEHFQGGNYEFAMAKAPVEESFTLPGYPEVEAGIVQWPMSVIRLRSRSAETLIEAGDTILKSWRSYTDEEAGIYAYSDPQGQPMSLAETKACQDEELSTCEPHNTITPIARKVGDTFELDLVLRNNLTTEEHPLGVFHPHKELHHIKKENIGLIEVMGLAVLPARLKEEMEVLKDYILNGKEIGSNEMVAKHEAWVKEVLPRYAQVNEQNIDDILKKEIGMVFLKVLEDAGVYKRDEKGKEAFRRFIQLLSN